MRLTNRRLPVGKKAVAVAAVAMIGAVLAGLLPAAGAADSAGSDSTVKKFGIAVGALEYDLGDEAFTDPEDWPHGSSELQAVIHYPRGVKGKVPVVVLQHGQQVACHSSKDEDWVWPCPEGVDPYPSNRGYDYLARALAKSGFVVLSPSANGINAKMGVAPQRARMINQHLEMLQQLSATGGGPLAGQFTDLHTGKPSSVNFKDKLDLSRVAAMGHSVAGEAAMYLASEGNQHELPEGVRIRGAVSMASPHPSGFFSTLVKKEPIAVISTGCWSLENERYFREGRDNGAEQGFLLRVVKGNHNYFNTEWTDGPGPGDGDDTTCPEKPNRPSAEDHRRLAVTYLRAFFRYALYNDRAGLPILTGKIKIPGVETETDSY